MTRNPTKSIARWAVLPLLLAATPASAHSLHKQGVPVTVADSGLTILPSRDWNQLSGRIGKNTEIWTLDGAQLNDVTFYGGIAPGNPLVKERSKSRAPLPKFTKTTLLAEIPDLLERTSRAYKGSGSFIVTSGEPVRFLNHDGISFAYEFTDEDQLPRKGEAGAAIVQGKLYMMTLEAPRLNYFGKIVPDFRALADSATLN